MEQVEYDYGQIRITPNIQDRVNAHKLAKAEEQASRQRQIAMDAHRAKIRAQAEVAQYRKANVALLQQIHATLGWPARAMLPPPEGTRGAR